MLVRVVAPHFVAGLVMRGELCVEAAPILRRACLGKRAPELRDYFRRQGFYVHVVRLSLADPP
jgi:hypothetical protein